MKVVIRPIEPSDENAWRTLWCQYLAFYETTLEDDIYKAYFQRLLSDDPHEYHGRLAVINYKPIGLVHYLFHRHGWQLENIVYLQDLFVDPGVRGTGAGRALIEAVYAHADAERCPSVYWLTQDFNQGARRLYDRVATLTPFIKYQRVTS